eukprot:evm.model.scf_1229.2 EVM.evm.TU.scf_1229.2   scf_1229:10278-14419(-)
MERGAAVPNCTGPAQIRKICVFCGSRAGNRPAYGAAAGELGREMVKRSVGLVYGGGTVGLMGRLAKTVVKGLGTDAVVGVIPTSLNLVELSGEMIGDTRVVDDMHERKGFVAAECRNNLITADDPGALIDLLSAFQGSVDPNLAVLQQTAKE